MTPLLWNRPVITCVCSVAGLATSAAAQCMYGVGGFSVPIPETGVYRYSLNGLGPGTVVHSVRLCFNITHPRQGDLVVRLIHDGVTATLLNRPGTEDCVTATGYTAANIGSSFTLADAGAEPYAVPPVGSIPRPGINNVGGVFRPTIDPLSVFNGTSVTGPWTIEVSDVVPGVTGTLTSVSIAINAVVASPCWANCDGNYFLPSLTASDFMCFLNKFAGNDPYANCDGSTGTPLLTSNDFLCFINKYAAGCT